MGQEDFPSKYGRLQKQFQGWLEHDLRLLTLEPELKEPVAAALLSAGKRVRPVLCLAAAEAQECPLESVRPFALALEYLHTSSLIHDDLPALDNDDLRRGEPTCHKRFGEAAAVLAGDLLLVESFGALSAAPSAETAASWLKLLSTSARELCDGQTLDLAIGGKLLTEKREANAAALERVCRKKTAALFRAALSGPCYAVAGGEGLAPAMAEFGEQLGLLFQLTDDLLDAAQDAAPGGAGEVNFVVLYGREVTERRADEALKRALELLPEGENYQFLRDFSLRVRTRRE